MTGMAKASGNSQRAKASSWADVQYLFQRPVPTYGGSIVTPSEEPPGSSANNVTATPDPPAVSVWPSERPRPGPRRATVVEEWEKVLRAEGRAGLADALVDYAEAQIEALDDIQASVTNKGRKSWEQLVRDREEGTGHIVSLLQALPDFILFPLLRCELPRKIREDPEVARFVERHMRLSDGPSIYVNLLHDRDGCWLSRDEMTDLLEKMESYIEDNADGPTDFQRRVDTRFSRWDSDKGLRWCANPRARQIIQQWIDEARKRYCDDPSLNTDPSERFHLGVAEVGWAQDPIRRGKQHMSNSSTTYIFGLL